MFRTSGLERVPCLPVPHEVSIRPHVESVKPQSHLWRCPTASRESAPGISARLDISVNDRSGVASKNVERGDSLEHVLSGSARRGVTFRKNGLTGSPETTANASLICARAHPRSPFWGVPAMFFAVPVQACLSARLTRNPSPLFFPVPHLEPAAL